MTVRPCLRKLILAPYTPTREQLAELGDVLTEGEPGAYYLLEDPEGFSPPLVLPVPIAVLISLMDGQRSLEEIAEKLQEMMGSAPSLEELQNIVEHMDGLHFLDSPAFEKILQEEKDAFQQRPRS